MVMTKPQTTKFLITQAVAQINTIIEILVVIALEMVKLASLLLEYPVVMSSSCINNILCSQLIAEIGDINRFKHKKSLVCFVGLDTPPFQSSQFA